MNRPKCAFLLSRQPRAVDPGSKWLRTVIAASELMVARNCALRCGQDLFTWDFCGWAYERLGGKVEVVPGSGIERDRAMILEADLLVEINVRARGNMAVLRDEARTKGIPIVRADELAVSVPTISSPPITAGGELPDDFLWHYTRGRPGPWPGESTHDYFESLFLNTPGAAHTGLDALHRILSEKKIRACGKLIRKSESVVCFSAAPPSRLLTLRRYKSSLLRWDFEPYALGVRRSVAERMGARPALYLHPDEYALQKEEDLFRYQKHLPPKVDTTHEEEWRHKGDFDFSTIPEEDLFTYAASSEGAS